MVITEEGQYLAVLAQLADKLRKTPTNARQQGPQEVSSVTLGLTKMEFDLSHGHIPLLTTKRMSLKNIVVELLWFLSGESRLDYMHYYNVHFWDMWATKETGSPYGLEPGDVGRIYGPNWIHWPTTKATDVAEINQIQWLIDGLKINPQWRRWWVSAWNPEFIDKAFLAPCHGTFHCLLVDGRLELHHMQRSGDWFLGVPYNIASYAVLLRMICQVTGLKPGKLVQITSDSHLYADQLEAAETQLNREPRSWPELWLNPTVKEIWDFRWPDHFALNGYKPHPAIKSTAAL